MSTYLVAGVVRVSGATSTPLAALVNPAASGVALILRGLAMLPIGRGSAFASGLLATAQLTADDALGSPPSALVERYGVELSPILRAGKSAIGAQRMEYDAAEAKALFFTNETHDMTEPVGDVSFNLPFIALGGCPSWSLTIGPGQTCLIEAMENGGGIPVYIVCQWEEVALVP